MEEDDDKDLEELVEKRTEDASKTFDHIDGEIFKLKPIPAKKGGGKAKIEVVENKRKTISSHNAMKHGKYSDLPIYCNDCYYRSKEAGGNGRCEAYKADSTCTVREDIKKYCGEMDSREPDVLKTIVDNQIKLLQERVMFSVFAAGMDGNLLDKATNAQMNTLHSFIKLAKDLQGTIKVTATQEEMQGSGEADFITKLFKQVSVEKG